MGNSALRISLDLSAKSAGPSKLPKNAGSASAVAVVVAIGDDRDVDALSRLDAVAAELARQLGVVARNDQVPFARGVRRAHGSNRRHRSSSLWPSLASLVPVGIESCSLRTDTGAGDRP